MGPANPHWPAIERMMDACIKPVILSLMQIIQPFFHLFNNQIVIKALNQKKNETDFWVPIAQNRCNKKPQPSMATASESDRNVYLTT
jgi:hypothetical protein